LSAFAPIRILIADDHPVVRDGLAAMLGTQPDFQIAGQADTGDEVLRQAAALRPDVILLDLEMPGMDGVAALRQLRAADPGMRAIVLTAYDSDELIVGALEAGAQGYLLKGAPREEIFQAIRIVHSGGSLLQPVVASKLLRQLSSQAGRQAAGSATLTRREREVLRLLAQGKSNREVAAALVVSERTAKFHVSSLMGKLGATNRTEAVSIAAQRGLIAL
jgi:DNA-binding NarL/FixJ family response regulator